MAQKCRMHKVMVIGRTQIKDSNAASEIILGPKGSRTRPLPRGATRLGDTNHRTSLWARRAVMRPELMAPAQV
jgi:hypothetical protein